MIKKSLAGAFIAIGLAVVVMTPVVLPLPVKAQSEPAVCDEDEYFLYVVIAALYAQDGIEYTPDDFYLDYGCYPF